MNAAEAGATRHAAVNELYRVARSGDAVRLRAICEEIAACDRVLDLPTGRTADEYEVEALEMVAFLSEWRDAA